MRKAAVIVVVVILAASGAWFWHAAHTKTAISSDVMVQPEPRRPSSDKVTATLGTLPRSVVASDPFGSSAPKSTAGEGERAEELTPQQIAERGAAEEQVATMLYGDLERELHLTAEQAGAIHALAIGLIQRAWEREPLTAPERRAATNDSNTRFRDEVAALLDAGQMVQFDEYRRTFDARAQIGMAGFMLADAKLPMDEDQRRSFIQAAIRNGAYLTEEEYEATDSETESAHRWMVGSEQRDALLLRSATGILSDEQLRKLRTTFDERHQAFNNPAYFGD